MNPGAAPAAVCREHPRGALAGSLEDLIEICLGCALEHLFAWCQPLVPSAARKSLQHLGRQHDGPRPTLALDLGNHREGCRVREDDAVAEYHRRRREVHVQKIGCQEAHLTPPPQWQRHRLRRAAAS
eukprot:COSAG01_NODE_2067_length_8506_cov_221.825384_2_plen_127_part_00